VSPLWAGVLAGITFTIGRIIGGMSTKRPIVNVILRVTAGEPSVTVEDDPDA
jgi:hypothetical protein